MLSKKAITSLAVSSVLFTGIAATANAAPAPKTTTVATTTATAQPTTAYYNYDGYVSAEILKDSYLKQAIDANGFKYNGVKLGDSLSTVKKVFKAKKYELKMTENKNVYTVHNTVLTFEKNKLKSMYMVFNRGKVTPTEVVKSIGKPDAKLTGQGPKGTVTQYAYNVKNGKAGVTVNFEKTGKKTYAVSVVVGN